MGVRATSGAATRGGSGTAILFILVRVRGGKEARAKSSNDERRDWVRAGGHAVPGPEMPGGEAGVFPPCNRRRGGAGVHFNDTSTPLSCPQSLPPTLSRCLSRCKRPSRRQLSRRSSSPSSTVLLLTKRCAVLERLNARRRQTRIRARAVADIVRGRFEHGTWGKRAMIAMGDVKFASGAQGAA